jgi:glycosyltransferase involved in cell wall biosynthesis
MALLGTTMPRGKLSIQIFAYWHDKGWKGFVGATVKIWDLAHNMAQLGHDVVLFLPNYDFSTDNLPFRLVQVPLLDFPLLRSLSFSFFLTFFLFRHHLADKPDVVYVRRGISILPAIFAKIQKAVLIYEVNDNPYVDSGARPAGIISCFDRWLAIKTDEIVLSWCDAAFVITKEIRDKLIRSLPKINPEKIHILPSGANTDLYQPLDRDNCRQRLNLGLSKKYICFMGTLLDHQGVDVLIEAAPAVINLVPDAFFVIIGEGPMKEIWRRRVGKLCIQDHFLFTGQVEYEETPIWISATDVCTAPFLKKAGLRSPVKVFDYLACGKPVIASKILGTTDIFEGSEAVRLVEPENQAALAAAIVEILKDEETARVMGIKGRSFVKSNYDRKSFAEKIQVTAYSLCNTKQERAEREES